MDAGTNMDVLFDCKIGWTDNPTPYATCISRGVHDESTVRDYIWSNKSYGIVRLCKHHIDDSNALGWTSEYIPGKRFTLTPVSEYKGTKIGESACRNCGKMCDYGSKKCWWCICPDPLADT